MAKQSLVIACGALAKELFTIKAMNNWDHYDVQCLDAKLHNRPALIVPKLRQVIAEKGQGYDQILIGYADCGTNGEVDELIESDPRLTRLPGPHCFSFFAGEEEYEKISEDEPGTFWLTDFLVRHFETMVIRNLGLDKHPELKDMYFGNYTQLIYVSQLDGEELVADAINAADRLGLKFRHIHKGFGDFEQALVLREMN